MRGNSSFVCWKFATKGKAYGCVGSQPQGMNGCGGNQSQGNLFSVGHAGPGLGKEKYASPSDISWPHHDPGYGGSPMLAIAPVLKKEGQS